MVKQCIFALCAPPCVGWSPSDAGYDPKIPEKCHVLQCATMCYNVLHFESAIRYRANCNHCRMKETHFCTLVLRFADVPYVLKCNHYTCTPYLSTRYIFEWYCTTCVHISTAFGSCCGAWREDAGRANRAPASKSNSWCRGWGRVEPRWCWVWFL